MFLLWSGLPTYAGEPCKGEIGVGYIHGSGAQDAAERQRLVDQQNMLRADIWRNLALSDLQLATQLPFLEVGSGVSAQTPDLLQNLPQGSRVIAIDHMTHQVDQGRKNMAHFITEHPEFDGTCEHREMDARHLEFSAHSLSGAYISWVLEHMPRAHALETLRELKRTIAPGGRILITEVHLDVSSSWIIKIPGVDEWVAPHSKKFLEAMIRLQYESRGNPNVGSPHSLQELSGQAGFKRFKYLRMHMHYDTKNPDLLKANAEYLIALWESVLSKLIEKTWFTIEEFEAVKREVRSATTLRQEAGQLWIEL